MAPTNRRPDRVAEAIREEVAGFLADGAKDPRVTGLVTVTGVEVTRDLRHAKVFVSVLGSETERKATCRPRSPLIDGVLLLDKPAGLTSHDAISRARRALGTRRIGHLGTLDPFATGLLVLLAGRVTRLAPYMEGEPKVYDATIAFGNETDT